jgi:hypothetical protein
MNLTILSWIAPNMVERTGELALVGAPGEIN